MRCERCKEEVYFVDACNFCNRKVCRACVKSSKNLSKISRVVICKDCWTDMKKRSKFKAHFKARKFERERD